IAALKALHAVFDHEQAHGVLRLGVGARRHHHQIGELAVGNVGFRAVQQPVIAHVYRSGLHAGEIGASAGLGHRHCENFLAGDAGRQPALFLLVGAEFIDIRRDQTGVQIDVEADIAVADVLFDDDLLEAEVIDAGSAVFLVGPQHQITLLAGLGVGPAVDITLLAPFLRVRADLVLEEAAYRAAKIIVFGFKYRSLHDSQLSNMGTRRTDALPQTQACAGPRNASKFACWRQHFTGDDRIHQSARDFRVEALAARGALAQPGRRLVARAIGFRHAIAFGDEFRSADHIDVRQRTAGPARKAPRQQRTDIAVGSMREYSLFEAARGFQRLDRQVARLHFFHRRLLGSQREGLFQARPQILLATFRVFVETGAILAAGALELFEHAAHDVVRARFDEAITLFLDCLLHDFPRQLDGDFIGQRQRAHREPGLARGVLDQCRRDTVFEHRHTFVN